MSKKLFAVFGAVAITALFTIIPLNKNVVSAQSGMYLQVENVASTHKPLTEFTLFDESGDIFALPFGQLVLDASGDGRYIYIEFPQGIDGNFDDTDTTAYTLSALNDDSVNFVFLVQSWRQVPNGQSGYWYVSFDFAFISTGWTRFAVQSNKPVRIDLQSSDILNTYNEGMLLMGQTERQLSKLPYYWRFSPYGSYDIPHKTNVSVSDILYNAQELSNLQNAYGNLRWQTGYDSGYALGYENGGGGVSTELNTNWLWDIVKGLRQILAIEILPNIKIGYILGIPILLGTVYFVLSFKNGRG